jgi:hypothetical protein
MAFVSQSLAGLLYACDSDCKQHSSNQNSDAKETKSSAHANHHDMKIMVEMDSSGKVDCCKSNCQCDEGICFSKVFVNLGEISFRLDASNIELISQSYFIQKSLPTSIYKPPISA